MDTPHHNIRQKVRQGWKLQNLWELLRNKSTFKLAAYLLRWKEAVRTAFSLWSMDPRPSEDHAKTLKISFSKPKVGRPFWPPCPSPPDSYGGFASSRVEPIEKQPFCVFKDTQPLSCITFFGLSEFIEERGTRTEKRIKRKSFVCIIYHQRHDPTFLNKRKNALTGRKLSKLGCRGNVALARIQTWIKNTKQCLKLFEYPSCF